jgi:hypothetical protein
LKSGDTFLAILFGFLAYGSIQMLQTRQYWFLYNSKIKNFPLIDKKKRIYRII